MTTSWYLWMNFTLAQKMNVFKTWSKIGFPASISIHPNSWNMSFVVAISQERLEGLMASTGSIVTKSFWVFMKKIHEEAIKDQNEPNKFWMVLDNASLHRNKPWLEIWNKNGMRWITISPYTPQFNAAEKIIAVIKNKMRTMYQQSKQLSLSIVVKILEEINSETCRSWIFSIQLEVIKTLANMKAGAMNSKIRR